MRGLESIMKTLFCLGPDIKRISGVWASRSSWIMYLHSHSFWQKKRNNHKWVEVWLGGLIRNTFKGQSRNKNWQNNILGPLFKNVFILIIFFFMFIYCMPKYMAWSFQYNEKRWKSLQIYIPYWCGPFRNQVFKLLKFIIRLYLFK
jgi:hypothetical protein